MASSQKHTPTQLSAALASLGPNRRRTGIERPRTPAEQAASRAAFKRSMRGLNVPRKSVKPLDTSGPGGVMGALGKVMGAPGIKEGLKALRTPFSFVASHIADIGDEVLQGDVGGTLGAIAGTGAGLLAQPAAMAAGAVGAHGVADQLNKSAYENDQYVSDFKKQTGAGAYGQRAIDHFDPNRDSWLNTSESGKWLKRAGGLFGDIALDPLTYLKPGSHILSGTSEQVAGRIAQKIPGMEADAMAQVLAKGGDEAAQLAAKKAVREFGEGVMYKVGTKGKQTMSEADFWRIFPDEKFAPGLAWGLPGTGRVGRRVQRTLGVSEPKQLQWTVLGKDKTNYITRVGGKPFRMIGKTKAFQSIADKTTGEYGPQIRGLLQEGDSYKYYKGLGLRKGVQNMRAAAASGLRMSTNDLDNFGMYAHLNIGEGDNIIGPTFGEILEKEVLPKLQKGMIDADIIRQIETNSITSEAAQAVDDFFKHIEFTLEQRGVIMGSRQNGGYVTRWLTDDAFDRIHHDLNIPDSLADPKASFANRAITPEDLGLPENASPDLVRSTLKARYGDDIFEESLPNILESYVRAADATHGRQVLLETLTAWGISFRPEDIAEAVSVAANQGVGRAMRMLNAGRPRRPSAPGGGSGTPSPAGYPDRFDDGMALIYDYLMGTLPETKNNVARLASLHASNGRLPGIQHTMDLFGVSRRDAKMLLEMARHDLGVTSEVVGKTGMKALDAGPAPAPQAPSIYAPEAQMATGEGAIPMGPGSPNTGARPMPAPKTVPLVKVPAGTSSKVEIALRNAVDIIDRTGRTFTVGDLVDQLGVRLSKAEARQVRDLLAANAVLVKKAAAEAEGVSKVVSMAVDGTLPSHAAIERELGVGRHTARKWKQLAETELATAEPAAAAEATGTRRWRNVGDEPASGAPVETRRPSTEGDRYNLSSEDGGDLAITQDGVGPAEWEYETFKTSQHPEIRAAMDQLETEYLDGWFELEDLDEIWVDRTDSLDGVEEMRARLQSLGDDFEGDGTQLAARENGEQAGMDDYYEPSDYDTTDYPAADQVRNRGGGPAGPPSNYDHFGGGLNPEANQRPPLGGRMGDDPLSGGRGSSSNAHPRGGGTRPPSPSKTPTGASEDLALWDSLPSPADIARQPGLRQEWLLKNRGIVVEADDAWAIKHLEPDEFAKLARVSDDKFDEAVEEVWSDWKEAGGKLPDVDPRAMSFVLKHLAATDGKELTQMFANRLESIWEMTRSGVDDYTVDGLKHLSGAEFAQIREAYDSGGDLSGYLRQAQKTGKHRAERFAQAKIDSKNIDMGMPSGNKEIDAMKRAIRAMNDRISPAGKEWTKNVEFWNNDNNPTISSGMPEPYETAQDITNRTLPPEMARAVPGSKDPVIGDFSTVDPSLSPDRSVPSDPQFTDQDWIDARATTRGELSQYNKDVKGELQSNSAAWGEEVRQQALDDGYSKAEALEMGREATRKHRAKAQTGGTPIADTTMYDMVTQQLDHVFAKHMDAATDGKMWVNPDTRQPIKPGSTENQILREIFGSTSKSKEYWLVTADRMAKNDPLRFAATVEYLKHADMNSLGIDAGRSIEDMVPGTASLDQMRATAAAAEGSSASNNLDSAITQSGQAVDELQAPAEPLSMDGYYQGSRKKMGQINQLQRAQSELERTSGTYNDDWFAIQNEIDDITGGWRASPDTGGGMPSRKSEWPEYVVGGKTVGEVGAFRDRVETALYDIGNSKGKLNELADVDNSATGLEITRRINELPETADLIVFDKRGKLNGGDLLSSIMESTDSGETAVNNAIDNLWNKVVAAQGEKGLASNLAEGLSPQSKLAEIIRHASGGEGYSSLDESLDDVANVYYDALMEAEARRIMSGDAPTRESLSVSARDAFKRSRAKTQGPFDQRFPALDPEKPPTPVPPVHEFPAVKPGERLQSTIAVTERRGLDHVSENTLTAAEEKLAWTEQNGGNVTSAKSNMRKELKKWKMAYDAVDDAGGLLPVGPDVTRRLAAFDEMYNSWKPGVRAKYDAARVKAERVALAKNKEVLGRSLDEGVGGKNKPKGKVPAKVAKVNGGRKVQTIQMKFPMPKGERNANILAETTYDALLDGTRTSTTRTDLDSIRAIDQMELGDHVEFAGPNGAVTRQKVTQRVGFTYDGTDVTYYDMDVPGRAQTLPAKEFLKRWSASEGWTPERGQKFFDDWLADPKKTRFDMEDGSPYIEGSILQHERLKSIDEFNAAVAEDGSAPLRQTKAQLDAGREVHMRENDIEHMMDNTDDIINGCGE